MGEPEAPEADVASLLGRRVGATLVLTLNRPHRANAVDRNLASLLGEAIEAADTDPEVRAVVLTGSGTTAFCGGGDLHAMVRDETLDVPGREAWGFAGIVEHFISKPIIAALNGAAVGGGFELVLACDLVLAVPEATLACPEVRHGGIAGAGGLIRLPRQVPAKVAMMMLLSGEPMSAEEGRHWGLVNEVVPRARLLDRAIELGARIAEGAPLAVAATKRVFYGYADGKRQPEAQLWEINEREAARVRASDDLRQGRRSKVEGRPQEWRGT